MGIQTILGSGGSIGRQLAAVLPEYTDQIRLVSRSPERINPSDELVSVDLLDAEQTRKAVSGSSVAYLTVGLKYSAKVWADQWPVVMRNTIAACASSGTRLVFFDNIYMYDRDHLGHMHEGTPVRPTSRKGKVRAQIADMLLEAHANGSVHGLIARSADFYGPGVRANGVLRETVFNNLASGKAAQWLRSVDKKHSFTYTPDAASGTALLGNADDTWGEVWHLPTAAEPLTGREWVESIADALHVEPKVQVAPQFLIAMTGLFVPVMKELSEMSYQYDRDYVFSSEKFNRRFEYAPVPYTEGIQQIVDEDFTDKS